ncbi:GntR family transcriptional regulator [Novosphingobium piscinae]|uniref:GntR family transcriptional regulator n=1 Tax=Novosphingobium piscinae TaxID=1507448 RepID=A0A7X1FZZ3_9SPHN|nr:GntR family transcriptional regulator [Novosphingobium piscinae]MBC2670103.1 GntR family transcriptional regulator [Novosphingobium piscinae]
MLPEAPGLLLSERIRAALADEIMAGQLKPGHPLDEGQIAARFGASRTPVREAIRELAAVGLLEVRPRRGAVVSGFDSQRVIDMFEMTAEIEAMCARLAAYRMNPVERSRLAKLHEESEAIVAAGDSDGYNQLNWDFHHAIYEGTHNRFIVEQAAALHDRMAAFRLPQLRVRGRLDQSHAEHGEVVAAIMRGDGEEAARCMRAHKLKASISLERYLASREL